MKTGTLLIGASILGFFAFGFKKVSDVNNLAKNIKPELKKINSVNFQDGKILLNVSIYLKNNSEYGTDLTKLITLKELKLYNESGKLLALTKPEISGLYFEPKQTITIDNINITATFNAAINEFISTQFKGKYTIVPTLEVLGKTWEIR